MELDKTTSALLYLMRCALQNTPPEVIPELDHDALFLLSRAHSVTAMIAMALEVGGLLTEQYTTKENVQKWKDARVKAVRKNILLDAEREQILRYLDGQGIWYLPLKGSVLQQMYPQMGMRQMADNDILFDRTYQDQLKAYMESRGYKTVQFGLTNHDVYEKPPVYNFEFHTALFSEKSRPELVSYYGDVRRRLQKDPDNAAGYHFSNEDFYIFLLAHAFKHYTGAGTGIRILSDIYVFLREKAPRLDWAYIDGELRFLGIREFETMAKTMGEKLFGGQEPLELTREEQEFLSYMLGSGAYGTTNNRIRKKLEQLQNNGNALSVWTKVRYIWERLFPDREFMKTWSPFCRKHEWSIPIFWIYRLIRSAVLRKNVIRAECHALKSLQ